MKLILEQWTLVLTVVVALSSLALSLYNWWQGRPRRRLEVSLDPNREFVEVIFMNERGPAVLIEEVGFEYPDGSHFELDPETGSVEFGDSVPGAVPPAGGMGRYRWPRQRLLAPLREGELAPVSVYCRDATGHHYKTSLSQETRSALLE